MAEVRTCRVCKRSLALSAFATQRQRRDGIATICTECNRAKAKEWARNNAERNRARAADWRKKNPERARAVMAAWVEKNLQRKRDLEAQWKQQNPERVRRNGTNRRARERAALGRLSTNIVELLWDRQRGRCPCCNKPLGGAYHLDHIVPLVAGGSNEDKNVQLLRSKCNLQKNKKDPVTFMQERGFLL